MTFPAACAILYLIVSQQEESAVEIQKMRATFGKLQDQTLELQPGLNCIYAPNESGKSTWSHFLRIMLYGLSTRDRGALADKNRFAPWSGAAMRGQMDVTDSGGMRLTLSRDTRRANAPMGHFACTYTGTADAVPGIDSQNAGETLLGVPREVFERSAFIRQSALAVDSDAELERRIAALITTGEEGASYTEVRDRLKKQLNRRRSNRTTGQIPVLEREIADLESQRAHRDDLTRQATAALQQLDSLRQQAEELQAQQALWRQRQQLDAIRQYRQAQPAAEEAERKAAWLLAESAVALPEDALLTRMEGQCAALQTSQATLGQAQAEAHARKAEADDAAARCAAHPLSPGDETACQAKLDAITAPAVPSPLLMIVGILLILGGGVCAALLHLAFLAFAVIGIGLTVTGLLRRKHAIAAQAKAAADRADMLEYYTLWAHQIKTPIAAMRLRLQSEDSDFSRRLLTDLGRIEQYVEMVLTYLRLEGEGTDYVFREAKLDDIVRPALRRFAGEFIARRLTLDYTPTDVRVFTDEKWLSFVIEQVLSNALKYTPQGGVSVYVEEPKTLCIRDTGIGIAPEDLPRIFERGYTGLQGRADKRASGIGLYLCRRICRNLGHTITAESRPGEGTTVRIKLEEKKITVE